MFLNVCSMFLPIRTSILMLFLVMVGSSSEFVVSRLGQNILSNLTNISNNFWFSIGSSSHTISSFRLGSRLRDCQNMHSGCRCLWFDLKSGLFCPRLAQTLLCYSTNLYNQLLFSIGSPNCARSTFPG